MLYKRLRSKEEAFNGEPRQLRAWTVKVHWGGEAALSQQQMGIFCIPVVHSHEEPPLPRMKPLAPYFPRQPALHVCQGPLHSQALG